MPWYEATVVEQRQEFVGFAKLEGANIAMLCRRYGVSRKSAYKWLARFRAEGVAGLADRSRRPLHSPASTPGPVVERVLGLRELHPRWGGRKLRRRLLDQGVTSVPAASTITQLLRRNGCIDPLEAEKHHAWQRFEHDAPNQMWQVDFKGHIAVAGGRCHPLTALDDHSRFALVLEACADEQGATVQQRLTGAFRRYGLPERILVDNGSPWGSDWDHPFTPLTVWLIRLGIDVSHSRPYHPQTQGKEERFHRTLKAELLLGRYFEDLAHCQHHFDRWRQVYNFERPHEALGLQTPASRYSPSPRSFPESLPPIEYGPGDIVRKVQAGGEVHYAGRVFRVGKAFHGYPIAIRPTLEHDHYAVYFCQKPIAEIDFAVSN